MQSLTPFTEFPWSQSLSSQGQQHEIVRGLVSTLIEDVQPRQRALELDPANDGHRIECLALLDELGTIHTMCGVGREFRELRHRIHELARQVIDRINTEAPVYLQRMSLAEVKQITRWGLTQATKDQLLMTAVRRNVSLPIIEHFVRCGADKHVTGWLGRNMLMIAAMHADTATVQYFIDQGLNPRARDNLGNTAVKLEKLYRHAPPLARLPENIFFPYQSDDIFALFLFSSALLCWLADVMITFLPIENKMIFHEIFSIGYLPFLAPLNSLFGELRERLPIGFPAAIRSVVEGTVSLSYMSHVIGSDSSGIASLVYLALSFLAYKCLDPGTFNTVFIDYIAPLAKCLNVASMVSMVFLSNHPVYAAVNLTLYTISLFDSYGYLPVPIQKVYYCGLRAIQSGMYAVGKVIMCVFAIPVVAIGSALVCFMQCICCCRL